MGPDSIRRQAEEISGFLEPPRQNVVTVYKSPEVINQLARQLYRNYSMLQESSGIIPVLVSPHTQDMGQDTVEVISEAIGRYGIQIDEGTPIERMQQIAAQLGHLQLRIIYNDAARYDDVSFVNELPLCIRSIVLTSKLHEDLPKPITLPSSE